MDRDIVWALTAATVPAWKAAQLVLALLGLGVLVFVHELGHFVVARLNGVRVEKFAIGFGRKLVGFRRGDTEYQLCLIPFGGYVKLAGEHPGESEAGAEDEYYSKTPGQRAAILVAGVAMNVVVGVLLFILAFGIGVRLSSPTVVPVVGGPAWIAGMQEGDTIVEVDGRKVYSLADVTYALSMSRGPVDIEVRRGDEIVSLRVCPSVDKFTGVRGIGVHSRPLLRVRSVVEGGGWLLALADAERVDWAAVVGRLKRSLVEGDPAVKEFCSLLGSDVAAVVLERDRFWEDRDLLAKVVTRIDLLLCLRDLPSRVPSLRMPPRLERLMAEPADRLPLTQVCHRNRLLLEVLLPELALVRREGGSGGLAPGDEVFAVNGVELLSWRHFQRIVSSSPGRTLMVKTARGIVAAVPMGIGGGTAGCVSVNDVRVEKVRRGSPAWDAGLRDGDVITAVDGEPTGGIDRLRDYMGRRAGKSVVLTVKRGKSTFKIGVVPRFDPVEGRGLIGVLLSAEPVVGAVEKGSPAQLAGVRSGDRVVSVTVGGRTVPVDSWSDFSSVVESFPGRKLLVELRRGEEEMHVSLTPRLDFDEMKGVLGVIPETELVRVRKGFVGAVRYGLWSSWKWAVRIVRLLGGLVERKISPKVLSGPVMIPVMGMWFVERGIGTFLYFLAMLSINFAVVNLLPLPVVDGGNLVLVGLEKVRGRPLPLRLQNLIQYAGLVLLLVLFLLITVQDISRIGGMLGW